MSFEQQSSRRHPGDVARNLRSLSVLKRLVSPAIMLALACLCTISVLLTAASLGSLSTRVSVTPPQQLPVAEHYIKSFELPSFMTQPVEEPLYDSTTELDSSKLQQPMCPKWEAFDKRLQMAKDFVGDCEMRSVESMNQNFKITLCASKTLCGQGYFLVERINKTVCDAALAGAKMYSPNAAANEFFKHNIGPDAFHLIFDGPERAAPTMWHHLGNCVYKLPYRLVNTGQYSLHLVHTYEQFAAVDEANHISYPTPVFLPLLTSFELNVCPHCTRFTSAAVWKMHKSLPLCSRTEPQQGVYLRMAQEGLRTSREQYKFQNYGHPYIWEPLGCRFDQLFELGDNTTCLSTSNYTVSMEGDSHSRVLWLLTDLRLRGSKQALEQNIKYHYLRSKYFDSTKMKSGESNSVEMSEDGMASADDHRLQLPHLDFEYATRTHLNDWVDSGKYVTEGDGDLLESQAERDKDKNDAIVLSAGHWPASGVWAGGHFNIPQYESFVEYAMQRVEWSNHRRASLKKKDRWDIIWFGVPAFTQQSDSNNSYASRLDWRTNYRLKLFSDVAERVVKRYPTVKVMNTFEIAFPWTQECPDGAHFLTTPALDAMVDEFLHKLNLCRV